MDGVVAACLDRIIRPALCEPSEAGGDLPRVRRPGNAVLLCPVQRRIADTHTRPVGRIELNLAAAAALIFFDCVNNVGH